MQNKVVYLGYYNVAQGSNTRSVSLACVNKMTYVIDCLERCGADLRIISPVNPINKFGIVRKYKTFTSGKSPIYFLPTFSGSNVFSRIIRKAVKSFFLFTQLISLSKDTTLIVYHSLGYAKAVKLAKRIKNFRLILEVEELYQDIEKHQKSAGLEDDIISAADSFIVSAQSIYDNINNKNKPYVVSCGTYKIVPKLAVQPTDSTIHVVYAGTFESQKGGVIQAIKSAKFLSEQFHIHILGFGSNEDTENVIKAIKQISSQSKAKITFEGSKTGADFNKFLQSCQIGLSTQIPDGKYNNTSFPSKILTYLSNGLKVVSVDIPVVRQSPLVDLITFYSGIDPKEIADAIRRANEKDCEIVPQTLNFLDARFVDELNKII